MSLLEDAIKAVDFVVIPLKPAGMDLAQSEDAITLCRDASKPYVVVMNDVTKGWASNSPVIDYLKSQGIPMAAQAIGHRVSHSAGMTLGKTGPNSTAAGTKRPSKRSTLCGARFTPRRRRQRRSKGSAVDVA